MKSSIIAFRDLVMKTIAAEIEGIEDVDWYDGVFDEKDVADWSLKTPCAFVSVNRAPMKPYATGERSIDLHVTVVIVTEDGREPRDGDEQCWAVMENLANYAHENTFGAQNSGPACDVVFERIADPVMRREGVAIGAVRWTSNIMIGPSATARHEFIHNPANGRRVTQLPRDLFLGISRQTLPDGTQSAPETLDLTEDDA